VCTVLCVCVCVCVWNGPGEDHLFHIISARPSKQLLLARTRTFLKVYGARLLFVFLQEQIKDIIIMCVCVCVYVKTRTADGLDGDCALGPLAAGTAYFVNSLNVTSAWRGRARERRTGEGAVDGRGRGPRLDDDHQHHPHIVARVRVKGRQAIRRFAPGLAPGSLMNSDQSRLHKTKKLTVGEIRI
jgi:hypothetical protein